MEVWLDPSALEQIIAVLRESGSHNPERQSFVYWGLEELSSSVPYFCCYLLWIATHLEFGQRLRLLSLLVLRRCLHVVLPPDVPAFVPFCYSSIVDIVSSQSSSLVPHALVLVPSLILRFDEALIADWPQFFLALLQTPGLAVAAVDSLIELAQAKHKIPAEIFRGIVALFQSAATGPDLLSALAILVRHLADGSVPLDVIHSTIFPALLPHLESLTPDAICDAMKVGAILFLRLGEPSAGDFVIDCLESQDEDLLAEVLAPFESETIPFYEPLVVALFNCLVRPEPPGPYSFVCQVEFILDRLCQSSGAETAAVIDALLRQSDHVGQQLRGLCLLAFFDFLDDPTQYVDFAASHLDSEFRRDAVICLLYCSNAQHAGLAVATALPMLFDCDFDMADRLIFTLDAIFEDDSLQTDPEWLEPLIGAYDHFLASAGHPEGLGLFQRVSAIFSAFLERTDLDPQIRDEVLRHIIETSFAPPGFLVDGDSLGALVQKDAAGDVLARVADVIPELPNLSDFSFCGVCRLLAAFADGCAGDEAFQRCFVELLQVVAAAEPNVLSLHHEFFRLVAAMQRKVAVLQSDFGEECLAVAIRMFGGFEGVETADAIAEVLAGHVKELPADVIVQMAEAASRMWETAREIFPDRKALRAFVTQILEIAAADGLLGVELAEFQAELVANVSNLE
jgi:hypothetical protein